MPNRREMLKLSGARLGASAIAATAVAVAGASRVAAGDGVVGPPPKVSRVRLPEGWRQWRKIDMHNHVMDPVHRPGVSWARVENMLEAADLLGIETLCCSRPIVSGTLADIDGVRDANDSVLAAMRRYPERISGFCFLQPGNGPAALQELERCFDAGMVGVKLYNQFKFSDAIVFPIAERCIELRIPLLGHSAHLTDSRSIAAQPKTSDSLDFCQLAWRYPELMLILGHVNGGGDWQWAIKGLRDCPSVYLDISGSVLENDTLEMCVRELGHERMLFATDQTLEGCVGKVLTAELTPEQREDIFWRNAHRLLSRRAA